MNVLVVVPTYNERENLPVLARGVLAHPASACWSSTTDRPTGPATIADALAAEHPGRIEVMHRTGQARARPVVHRRPAARRSRWTDAELDLPDGRRPLAQPGVPSRADGGGGQRRRRHRLALSERRQRRELAAAPDLSQHVRQSLHPRGDAAVAERLHQRLPLLAARGAGAAAARQRWCRTATPSSSRCCSTPRGTAAGFGEVPIIFVERRQGQSKLSSGVILESVVMPWRLKLRGARR